MPSFSYDDPNFFDDVVSESMRWYQPVLDEFGARGGRVVLGDDPWDLSSPCVAILELPPGETVHRHSHDCHVFVVVVRGSLEVGGGVTLVPGDVDVRGRGEFYGPFSAGPEGVLLYEFLSTSEPTRLVAEEGADATTVAYIDRVHAAERRAEALVTADRATRSTSTGQTDRTDDTGESPQ